MTREEWLSATDPLEMVNTVAERLSDRKLRLFLVACCRRFGHLPVGPGIRAALEAAERFADGACGPEELGQRGRAALQEVYSADRDQPWRWLPRAGKAVSAACSTPDHLKTSFGTFAGRYRLGSYRVMKGVDMAAEAVADYAIAAGGDADAFEQVLARERTEQCRLLRDVVGDPFQPTEVDPSWLAWNGGTVVGIARAAYEERAFDRLPVLADALEEAGCSDAALLGHLRGQGPHVLGCHAVDLLLGKS